MNIVSVLLPVYNTHPQHLRTAIDSVLNQTFKDFELIIYNDASTNADVEDVIKTYQDSRIRYFSGKENLGISKVRNKLIALSDAQYLAVMDHDDLYALNKLEKQVAFMDKNPEIAVCGTSYRKFGRLFKNKTIVFPQNNDVIRAELFFKNVIHHPSVMIRKDTLTDNNISYDESYISVNDRKMFMDIAQVSKTHNLPDVLCKYRMHKNMTSKIKRKEISLEQKRLRHDFLNRVGIVLSTEEETILNEYVLKGRTRIKQYEILEKIELVLTKLMNTNNQSLYFDKDIFSALCAKYLVKRCMNAAFYGQVSSHVLFTKTSLPIHKITKPVLLRIVNFLKK